MKFVSLFASVTIATLSIGATCNPPVPTPPSPDATDAVAPPVVDAAPPPIPVEAAPAPTVDAAPVQEAAPPAPTTDCGKACAALALATCPVGQRSDCEAWLTRDLAPHRYPNKITGIPLTCADLKAIKTKADAIKLGFVCQ